MQFALVLSHPTGVAHKGVCRANTNIGCYPQLRFTLSWRSRPRVVTGNSLTVGINPGTVKTFESDEKNMPPLPRLLKPPPLTTRIDSGPHNQLSIKMKIPTFPYDDSWYGKVGIFILAEGWL